MCLQAEEEEEGEDGADEEEGADDVRMPLHV